MDCTMYGQLQMHIQGRQPKPKLQYNWIRLTAKFAMLPKLSPSRILPLIHLYCTCTATCTNMECISKMHSTSNSYFFKNQDVTECCIDLANPPAKCCSRIRWYITDPVHAPSTAAHYPEEECCSVATPSLFQCSTITADTVHFHTTTTIRAVLAVFHNKAIIVDLALFCTFHFSIATPFPTADLALKIPLPQLSPALQHYNTHTWEYSATVLWCPQKLQHLLIAVTHIHFLLTG